MWTTCTRQFLIFIKYFIFIKISQINFLVLSQKLYFSKLEQYISLGLCLLFPTEGTKTPFLQVRESVATVRNETIKEHFYSFITPKENSSQSKEATAWTDRVKVLSTSKECYNWNVKHAETMCLQWYSNTALSYIWRMVGNELY